ncbi:SNF3 family helicase/atpase [Rhodotorula toruloides]|uniref:SNF3 family helicase/atpase n=1 Tax=Rhodotorula toruloides TaxID=5286 RepID=A0A511KCA4_RHOTO|nr:SNF3 family helicase/atpase [Rhodotorula toruloides]
MPQSSPQRTKPTVPVKRVDTIVLDDSDDEGNHASTSTPATSIGTPRREEESTKTDERAEESIDVEIVEPASAPENKPVTLKDAFKNVIKKAKIYTQKLEEFQRKRNAWLAEKKAAEADYDDPSTGSKKRKAKASLPPKKSKKKRSQKEEDAKKELPFEVPVPAAIKARLKDYQLADEMGTGKTLQSITLLSFIYEAFGAKQPAIVVLPKAVQQNWAEELKRWAPSLPFMVYAGTKDERALLREKLGIKAARTPLAEGDAVAKLGAVRAKAEVARWPRSDPNRTKPYPIILVTYNILLRDIVWLWQLTYSLIVCDEAHKAKNLSGKTLNSLKYLRGDFRLLLTGTPLQNNLTELYALLSFILPQIFNDRELFEQQFDFSAVVSEEGHRISEQEEVQLLVAQLHEILSPYMLRRCKKDVIKDLPLKKEYVLTAKMTKQQKEMTEAALEGQLRAYLAGTTTDNSRESTPRLSNGRGSRDADIINPALLNEKGRRTRKRESRSYKEEMHESMDDDEFEQQLAVEVEAEEKRAREKEVAKLQGAGKRDFDLRAKHTKFNSMMTNLRQIANHPLLKQDTRMPKDDPELIVKLSGKMMLLDRLLPALLERGHKIIIFSQFVKMLDLLDDYIELRGLKRFRLDGQAEYKADQDEIREFNTAECTEESTNIFLVSTKAGGVGINLVGADTVIIFDSDWNPQNDLQAMDRAHRIGQTKPVLVFRLASANSIEQTLLASATRKRKLERVVLGNEAALAGDGASAASSFINGVKGKKPGKGQAKNEAIKTLAQKLLEAEGELVSLDEGDEILSDEQLESLLDRSDEAMTSTESSKPTAGKQAAFEVVETIEEETIQQENLLGGVLGDIADLTTATTTDEEDDDEIDDAQ